MDDLLQTISRIRRAMPRNADVMAVCDFAERAATMPARQKVAAEKLTRAQIQKNYRERKKAKAL